MAGHVIGDWTAEKDQGVRQGERAKATDSRDGQSCDLILTLDSYLLGSQ